MNGFRVARGQPDEVELAALVLVLLRTTERPAGAPAQPTASGDPGWDRDFHVLRWDRGFRAPQAWR
jgi:hypothetical protein